MTARAESGPPICELYSLLAEYCLSTGASSIKDVPGCWEHQINEHWWVAANGHSTPQDCSKSDGVPPFSFVLFYGDLPWPTVLVGPYQGLLVGGHDLGALEDQVIAAVKAAIG